MHIHNGLRPKRLAFVAALLAGAWTVAGHAADWSVDPRVDLSVSYDDNLTLATNAAAKQSAASGLVDATASITARSPTSVLELLPRVVAYGYNNNVDQNSTDAFLTARVDHTGLKSRSALLTRYTYQSLFRQVVTGTDIGFELGGVSNSTDLRAIIGHNHQTLIEVDPSASFSLTQRANLSLAAYMMDSDYGRTTVDYSPFTNILGIVGLGYSVTPRSTWAVRATASKFHPKIGAGSSTTGLQTEWSTAQTAVQRYYFRIGADRTRFDNVTGAPAVASKTTASGGLGTYWVWQVNGLFADLGRNVYPSSTGRTTTNTELRLRFQHLFSQRVSGDLGLHGVQYDVVGGGAPASDGSRYVTLNASGEWRFTRTMSLRGTVSRTTQRLNSRASQGSDNFVLLSFIYEPHRGTQSAAIYVH